MLKGLVPYFNRGAKSLILRKCTKSWYWLQEKKFTVAKKKSPLRQSTNGTTPKKIVICSINSARGAEHKFRNSDVSKKIKYRLPNKTDQNSLQSANFSQNNIENLCPEEEKNDGRNGKPISQKIVTNSSLLFASKYNSKI
jgi:hypothetical protein